MSTPWEQKYIDKATDHSDRMQRRAHIAEIQRLRLISHSLKYHI